MDQHPSPPAHRLRATWVPSQARTWRRAGGPWDGPNLDQLLSAGGGGLVDGPVQLGPAALESLVATVAGGLVASGARPGAVVAWQLPNCLAAAVLYRACWRMGAVAAPLLHTLGPADRLGALDQVRPAVTLEVDPAAWSDPDQLVAALGSGRPVPAGQVAVGGSALAVALFTSGSTGVPKAVLHTHRGLSWKARLMARIHGLGPGDAVLMPAPLAHVSGLLNGVLLPMSCGMRSVLMGRFDPERALDLVRDHRVSFLAGPPTFFVAMAGLLADAPGRVDVSSLRLVSSGGAAVTPAFVESTAATFACRVKRTYGSTEAPTVTTSTEDDPAERAAQTDGRAVGEVQLRVVDPDTHRLRRSGQPGELWVRGPELFAGYADPAQNAPVLARGGWFRTGDLATVDHDGWLRIVGRLKDVIIRGGENISASEVEGVLEAHPAIRQAVAVGYPDQRLGERVAAFVVGPDHFDLEDCARWFTQQGVARFKTPEMVLPLPRLPLLGSGKPDRAALTQQAARAAQLQTTGGGR